MSKDNDKKTPILYGIARVCAFPCYIKFKAKVVDGVKQISDSRKKELKEANQCRKSNGLPLIKLQTKKCIRCGHLTEVIDRGHHCPDCVQILNSTEDKDTYVTLSSDVKPLH